MNNPQCVEVDIEPPTSRLPKLPRLLKQPLPEIRPSLDYLRTLYSPEVRGARRRRVGSHRSEKRDVELKLEEIRADKFERDYATRWLVGFISAAHDDSDPELYALVDDASSLLALWAGPASSGRLTRTFTFGPSPLKEEIRVTLSDAPMENGDYGTLGAQTWGGACVMADMIVEDPAQFGIPERSGSDKLRVLELGAGTGLVGLAIAHLLRLRSVDSEVVLSDFHPTILKNLQANVEANFSESSSGLVHIRAVPLDWSKFTTEDAQRTALGSFDIIVGADIIYEEQHAIWIKSCLETLLLPSAAFHLVIPLRRTHAFESGTIPLVFKESSEAESEKRLVILHQSRFTCDTEDGLDEVEYVMYKIGWGCNSQKPNVLEY